MKMFSNPDPIEQHQRELEMERRRLLTHQQTLQDEIIRLRENARHKATQPPPPPVWRPDDDLSSYEHTPSSMRPPVTGLESLRKEERHQRNVAILLAFVLIGIVWLIQKILT